MINNWYQHKDSVFIENTKQSLKYNIHTTLIYNFKLWKSDTVFKKDNISSWLKLFFAWLHIILINCKFPFTYPILLSILSKDDVFKLFPPSLGWINLTPLYGQIPSWWFQISNKSSKFIL